MKLPTTFLHALEARITISGPDSPTGLDAEADARALDPIISDELAAYMRSLLVLAVSLDAPEAALRAIFCWGIRVGYDAAIAQRETEELEKMVT